jgi:hypothetical protein
VSRSIHGNRPVFSASSVLDAIAGDLLAIKNADKLTYSDLGAVLGKSEDQAAKYCDGSATMDAVAFARGKREWNGRFTGSYDRLCVESRPAAHHDRQHKNAVLRAALAMAEALEDDDEISPFEVAAIRVQLERAKDAIDALLQKGVAA